MGKSLIEWTDVTWNAIWGCSKVSPGCARCYGERMSRRLGWDFGTIRLLPHKLEDPLKIKEPSMIFVNAFSDLFHPEIPRDYVNQIFTVMSKAPHHTYQILTKRPRQMKEYVNYILRPEGIPENWWFGVSIENERYLWRLHGLAETDAPVRFASFEPLLGRIEARELSKYGYWLDWVIVGGESDLRNPRPMDLNWAREIRDFCINLSRYVDVKPDAKIPFFFKQVGGSKKCRCHLAWGYRLLDNRTWDEYPPHIR